MDIDNKIFKSIILSTIPPKFTNVLWLQPKENGQIDIKIYTTVKYDENNLIQKWVSIGVTGTGNNVIPEYSNQDNGKFLGIDKSGNLAWQELSGNITPSDPVPPTEVEPWGIYFSTTKLQDFENIGKNETSLVGTFTPTQDGYLYIILNSGQRLVNVATKNQSMLEQFTEAYDNIYECSFMEGFNETLTITIRQ